MINCTKCGRIHSETHIPKYCSNEPRKPHIGKFIYYLEKDGITLPFSTIGAVATLLKVGVKQVYKCIDKRIDGYLITRKTIIEALNHENHPVPVAV